MLVAEVTAGKLFECLITDDRELLRLNRDFLGHDYPTDVLSFPSGVGGPFLGEIAISKDRAAEQAAAFGHGITEELKILMLHGVLHLSGWITRRIEARWPARKSAGGSASACPWVDRAGKRMTTIILLVVMFVGALLLVHVTLVQMLYMDTVRLRARELPFLEMFRSGFDERLGLKPDEGILTFSLVKHTMLALLGALSFIESRAVYWKLA